MNRSGNNFEWGQPDQKRDNTSYLFYVDCQFEFWGKYA